MCRRNTDTFLGVKRQNPLNSLFRRFFAVFYEIEPFFYLSSRIEYLNLATVHRYIDDQKLFLQVSFY